MFNLKNKKDKEIESLNKLIVLKDEKIELLEKEILLNQKKFDVEFQKFRERQEKQVDSFKEKANESLLISLLPVLDGFDNAVTTIKAKNNTGILDGVTMVYTRMLGILEKYGLKSFESVGRVFDPNKHCAVDTQFCTDIELNNIIQEEYTKGYTFKNKVLRFASVIVYTKQEPQNISISLR